MNKAETKLFLEILSEIPDHREGNAIRHRLVDIITIALLAILCNANTLTGIERFGKTHEKELREYLELPNGIPSHDTFGDVLGRLDYTAVNEVFQKWLEGMHGKLKAKSVAIDGKTICRSGNAVHKAAHIVTAYSSDLQLVLGQTLTEEKSNEMTAIPQLLDAIDIHGATVTIDAMGTQTAIAGKIIEQGGEYILGLKENQPHLLEDARMYYEEDYQNKPTASLKAKGCYAQTMEKGHGRIEKRECWLMKERIDQLRRTEVWPELGGIAVIRSTRTMISAEKCEGNQAKQADNTSVAYRYFLFSNKSIDAEQFLKLQRQHWSIENNLHWALDVVFREDSTHARAEHIAVVLNLFRKLILQLLKHDTTLSGSMAGKREICAWRFDLALNLLLNASFS